MVTQEDFFLTGRTMRSLEITSLSFGTISVTGDVGKANPTETRSENASNHKFVISAQLQLVFFMKIL